VVDISPYNPQEIHDFIWTFGQSAMPWGTEWAIFIILLFAWAYTAVRAGFEKSLPVGFAMFLMGTVAQYFLIGPGYPLVVLALTTLAMLLIYLLFLRKL